MYKEMISANLANNCELMFRKEVEVVREAAKQFCRKTKREQREKAEEKENKGNDPGEGGVGNLTCPWYVVVPFFRVPVS